MGMNKGMKVKSHKFHVTPQSNKLEDMQDKFENELKQHYVVEIPHTDPQRDDRNKVIKVKRVAWVKRLESISTLITHSRDVNPFVPSTQIL
jgi:hypothetical protein